MRICVTGGNGMIGSCIKNLTNLYINDEFIFLSHNMLDLTNREKVFQYFNSNHFDAIIHLAADVGGLYKNINNNITMFNNNIAMNQNILEAAYKNNIKKGIFCLSSCIYTPNPNKFPMDENMIHIGPPHTSNEGYAYAKRMLEVQCKNYNKAYGTSYICVIPVNLYGPYDNYSLENGHIIPMILHRFYKEQLNNNIIAYGTGKPLRQFLYNYDFAKIICNIITNDIILNTEPIIICNDQEYTIKTVVEKISDTMNIPKNKIIWDNTKSDGCYRKTVSNNKFKTMFPNFKFTSLDEGLHTTYKWFTLNYPNIRI